MATRSLFDDEVELAQPEDGVEDKEQELEPFGQVLDDAAADRANQQSTAGFD